MSNQEEGFFVASPYSLRQKYNSKVADVYGRIWYRCRGEKGICNESVLNIAEALNFGESTVRRALKILVDDGVIAKLTSGHRYSPHIYTIIEDHIKLV